MLARSVSGAAELSKRTQVSVESGPELAIQADGDQLDQLLINLIRSIRHGEKAEGNIWNSRSPEWQVPSPMPLHNYEHAIEVVGEPYDYGLAGSQYTRTIDEN